MPCTVTAFSVSIASQGDWELEIPIAREVICDWNAAHAWATKQVLVAHPRDGSPVDLLVAFHSALKSGSVEGEIDRQVDAGKPVLIYFSGDRTALAHSAPGTLPAVEELRSRFGAKATVDSFGDEKDFRAKLARHLEATIQSHPSFKIDDAAQLATCPVTPETPLPAQELSESARALLISACNDPEAYIGRVKDAAGLKIQVNGAQLVDSTDPASAARWENAFNELLRDGLIRDAGCNGRLFQISALGFQFLERIGKRPVGYIAEQGGF